MGILLWAEAQKVKIFTINFSVILSEETGGSNSRPGGGSQVVETLPKLTLGLLWFFRIGAHLTYLDIIINY